VEKIITSPSFRHGSLFSGIGGFDLAAEWMGWQNIFHCEINQFGQKILKYYWPDATSYEDITKTDFSIYRGTIDILTGGFPCQPYSLAGKRKGKADNRHLWPEMLRAIGEIQPRWVVGENVFGLINWDRGLVFHEVQTDLEAKGYEVFPYVLPACAVDAPHRRDRIWFVAYAAGDGHTLRHTEGRGTFGSSEERRMQQPAGENSLVTDTVSYGCQRSDGENEINTDQAREYAQHDTEHVLAGHDIANTEIIGVQRSGSNREQEPRTHGKERLLMRSSSRRDWAEWPTQSPFCFRDDGLSTQLDGITFSKLRIESIKGGGNAIVPEVAHQIFKAIQQYEHINYKTPAGV